MLRKQLSILRITSALYPDVVGGHAIQCHELSSRQVEQGHKVVVITLRRDRSKPLQELTDSGYSVIRLDKVWMPWESMDMANPFLPALSNVIHSLDFDIMHAHSHLFWMTAMAVNEAKRLNKPIVTTVHGVMAKRNIVVNLSQVLYLYSFGSWISRNSSRLVCLTKSDAFEMIHYGAPSEKIVIIPNAVNADLFLPGVDSNFVLWVGRFVAEKGLAYLIEAARLVAEKIPEVKFILVGDGPLKTEVTNYVMKNGLSRNFHFAGKLNQKEVANLMSKSSVFVLPSLKEGFPKTLLEAMACGKPIIASNIPGVENVVKISGGLLVPPKNSKKLADALIRLLDNKKLRREMGKNSRCAVLQEYTWDKVAEKLQKIYFETIEESRFFLSRKEFFNCRLG